MFTYFRLTLVPYPTSNLTSWRYPVFFQQDPTNQPATASLSTFPSEDSLVYRSSNSYYERSQVTLLRPSTSSFVPTISKTSYKSRTIFFTTTIFSRRFVQYLSFLKHTIITIRGYNNVEVKLTLKSFLTENPKIKIEPWFCC